MHSLHDRRTMLLEQVVTAFALGCLNACLGGGSRLGSIMQGYVLVRNILLMSVYTLLQGQNERNCFYKWQGDFPLPPKRDGANLWSYQPLEEANLARKVPVSCKYSFSKELPSIWHTMRNNCIQRKHRSESCSPLPHLSQCGCYEGYQTTTWAPAGSIVCFP